MIFSTYWFLTFLVFFLPVYYLAAGYPRMRLAWLLAGSALFHFHFAGPAGLLPIILLGITVYFLGKSNRPAAHIVGIALSVATLFFYKYTLFFILNLVRPIFPELGTLLEAEAGRLLPATPPLAISFFVFEFVHYLVDRKLGHPAIVHPAKFALFSIFFPTLVAGPIKRYENFLPALSRGLREAGQADFVAGLLQAALGFSKKLFADNLTQWLEGRDGGFAESSLSARWTFLVALAFRILLDFSGYSDIAIGVARLMGIRIPANFNWPYLATNLRDFWQRWHISLSSWIRDYVYIPLGGNRLGAPRQVVNGLIAFGLCGLWHGAAWNFIAWGVYHGAGLAWTHAYRQIPGMGSPMGRFFDRIPWAGWAVTLLFVWFGWLLFFYPPAQAWEMFRLLWIPR
jgi:alginate O-acetyltransferase complex protein AlgI